MVSTVDRFHCSVRVEKEVLGYQQKNFNNASIVVIVVKILKMLQQLLLFTDFKLVTENLLFFLFFFPRSQPLKVMS